MKKLLSVVIWMISKLVGRRNFEKFIIFSAKSINTNLHQHGLLQIGAGTGVHLENGSELFFIKNILAKRFENTKEVRCFDVGANVGNYSIALKEHIKNAEVYAFEPVRKTFEQLRTNVGDSVNAYNIGFGNLPGKGILYNTVDTMHSEITTSHKNVLTEIFKSSGEVTAIEFEVDTIDNFCRSNDIKTIDFLKIDVEGDELQVLQGASTMLANKAIPIIQFEFNTHNIYARVFLYDFYLLLKDFDFYRLNQKWLVYLGKYNASNEIFTAQNIIAVHRTLPLNIDHKYFSCV
jgi:FkbM family methyltransferase